MKKSKKIRGTMTRTRRVLSLLFIAGSLFCLTSCEVVRTIVNTSEYKQVDDKHVVIETKTIESYVGSKNELPKI